MAFRFRSSSSLNSETASPAAPLVAGRSGRRAGRTDAARSASAKRRDDLLSSAVASFESLEGRRLMSASLDEIHLAPAGIAGKVFGFAPQPTAHADAAAAAATSHTKGVPVLSSRPGAAYSVFIDFSGFNYVGSWNGRTAANGDLLPGFTPSFDDVSPTGTFNAAQQTAIKTVFARMAQSYSNLDVNITTVDPAPAAIAGDDVARRDFYDAKPNFMHMVFGSSERAAYVTEENPSGNWTPGADGISPGIGVASGRVDGPNALQGQHTSFMFTQGHADNNGPITNFDAEYVGGIGSHENAHSFGLNHQGDYTGNGKNHINEYSFGDDRTAPFQVGTYVPIIGDGNSAQRIAWRVGTDDEQDENGIYTVVNDLQRLLFKSSAGYAASEGRTGAVDLHFVDDGVGNTLAAATPLPLTGSTVDSAEADGVIVPKSESNPVAIGASNYTTDYFSFVSNGGTQITLNVNDSTQLLVAGKADSAGTLRSTLKILKPDGTLVASGTESASTLVDTFTGVLPAGTYIAAIGSFGGHQQVNAPVDGVSFDPAYYFDTGAFFLTGSGFGGSSVNTAPVVTDGPLSKTVTAGATVTFSAAATGTPTPTVKWQVSTNGGSSYTNIAGATSTTYTFTATAAQTGNKYRAVFTNAAGSETTAVATLTVGSPVGAKVTGLVFNDHNGSGTKDAGDAPMAGVKVFVDADRDGIYKAGDTFVTTNSAGVYTFTNLPAGTYAIATQPPSGFQQNFPFGTFDRTVTVAAGGVVLNQDFAETTSSHVAGFVRAFSNGVYTNLANVTVTIKAADGSGATYVRKTDSAGYYGIGGLPNKAYKVTLTLPPGYKLASGSTVRTTPVLASGKNADDISFKLLPTFM